MSSHTTTLLRARLAGLDAARGIAVLGMFTAHLRPDPGPFDWARPASWVGAVDGRSSVLFALCAGVSLALMTARVPHADIGRRVLLRSVALFVLGSVLMALGTPVLVILPMYAVVFVASAPLLRARTGVVLAIAVAALVLGPPATMLGSLVVAPHADPLVSGVLFGAYPAVTWWSVVLVGVLLVRLDLGRIRTQLGVLGSGIVAAVIGYGGGLLLSRVVPSTRRSVDVPTTPSGTVAGAPPIERAEGAAPSGAVTVTGGPGDWHTLVSVEPHAGSTFEVLGAIGVALAVLALALLVARRAPAVLTPLAAVGRLAFTLYAAHILVIAVLERCGVEPSSGAGPLGGWLPLLILAGGAVVVASCWRRPGPLERAVSSISRRFDHPADQCGDRRTTPPPVTPAARRSSAPWTAR